VAQSEGSDPFAICLKPEVNAIEGMKVVQTLQAHVSTQILAQL
jgi:hypothetical protein